ncbi:hypothetical protein BDR05DRAFT_880158 [Suillus weaverae]|nr:hypothetical protein BDR05DRAFT_880158 [Suillus weaverae]
MYLDIILESKNLVNGGICECCLSAEGLFWCSTCSGEHAWCWACILKPHQSLPFHKLQHWNGKCFQDSPLS